MLLVEARLAFFSEAFDDLCDGLVVLLHFLVVAAALARISGDDHVRHHFIDFSFSNFLLILEQLLKEFQKHNVSYLLLFCPPSLVVLGKLPEGKLRNSKIEYFWYQATSNDLELIILTFCVCHISKTINYYPLFY